MLLALDLETKMRHREAQAALSREAAAVAAASAAQHADCMALIKETSSTSVSLLTEAGVKIAGLETRSLALEDAQGTLGVQLQQVSAQLHTLHSVTNARLSGLEEMLQRLLHKADVSRGA